MSSRLCRSIKYSDIITDLRLTANIAGNGSTQLMSFKPSTSGLVTNYCGPGCNCNNCVYLKSIYSN